MLAIAVIGSTAGAGVGLLQALQGESPHLIPNQTIPLAPMAFGTALLVVFMGWWAVRMTQRVDRFSSTAAGFGVGLAAGLTAFLVLSPFIVVQAQARIVNPMTGVFEGIVLSMGRTLFPLVLFGMASTWVAQLVMRDQQNSWQPFARYLEATGLLGIGLYASVSVLANIFFRDPLVSIVCSLLVGIFAVTMSLIPLTLRIPFSTRLAFYLSILAFLLAIGLFTQTITGLVVLGVALVLPPLAFVIWVIRSVVEAPLPLLRAFFTGHR